jgi:hypothetical protein
VERKDIENMVNAMMAEALTPVRRDVSEVRARILNIDGDGSGRPGILQRQNEDMREIKESIKVLGGNVDTVLSQAKFYDKKNVWQGLRTLLGIIIALLGLLLGFLTYEKATHPNQSLISREPSTSTQGNDAGVDGR